MHYVYILEVRDRGKRDSFFYVGETFNVRERYAYHLRKIRSDYLTVFHPHSSKKLMYVEVVDSEGVAKSRVNAIKKLTHIQKRILISRSGNRLLSCKPNYGNPTVELKE